MTFGVGQCSRRSGGDDDESYDSAFVAVLAYALEMRKHDSD